MDLLTPDEMREMDRATIEDVGLSGDVLMERAALGAVEHLLAVFDSPERVGILCGSGNNGGDGAAMARLLDQRGVEVQLAYIGDPASTDGEARANLDRARALDLPVADLSDLAAEELDSRLASDLPDCNVWGDAMLGTGLTGEVRGAYVSAIEFLNRQDRVFAIDIQRGLDGSTGQPLGISVDADATATFGGAKLGQALYPGRELCGDLAVIDIGIPRSIRREVGARAQLLDREWMLDYTGTRPRNYHKGSAGRVLAVAGSHRKTGAALLTARGALKGGAGLITVGTTPRVVSRIAPAVNEVMADELVADEPDPLVRRRLSESLADVDVAAVGPGLETDEGAEQAVATVLDSDVPTAVLDADALNLVAGDLGLDRVEAFSDGATAVLTPHPGEMARLCGSPIDDILASPVDSATWLAEETGALVVLKMAATVVAAPDGRLAVNSTGNPGMATGGTGDVLTGLIAARLADGAPAPFDDVCTAVYTHGLAGDLAEKSTGERGLTAGTLADHLPEAWRRLESSAS